MYSSHLRLFPFRISTRDSTHRSDGQTQKLIHGIYGGIFRVKSIFLIRCRVVPWICPGDGTDGGQCTNSNKHFVSRRGVTWVYSRAFGLACGIRTTRGSGGVHMLVAGYALSRNNVPRSGRIRLAKIVRSFRGTRSGLAPTFGLVLRHRQRAREVSGLHPGRVSHAEPSRDFPGRGLGVP